MNDAISKWLRRCNSWKFVLFILLFSYVIALPSMLLDKPHPSAGPQILEKGAFFAFMTAVVVGPVLETAIFQALPIYIFRDRFKMKYPLIILISALFFGLMHWYSVKYVIMAFLVGLLFAYAYIVRRKKGGNPFLLITIVHSVRNLIAFFVTVYF